MTTGNYNMEWFLGQRGVRNAYLEEPEWRHLYIRRGILVVRDADENPIQLDDSIHLANFEVKKKKRDGAFTRMIERIEKAAPGLPIFIENLTNPDFAAKLPELGFEPVYINDRGPGIFQGSWCFLKRYPNA